MAFSLDQFYKMNRRALIWIILAVIIYLLRDFFGLIFLTFVLTFLTTPIVRFGQRRLRLPRRLSIVIVYGCFVMAVFGFARYVTPQVIDETMTMIERKDEFESKVIELKDNLLMRHPSLRPLVKGYLGSALAVELPEAGAAPGGTAAASGPAAANGTTGGQPEEDVLLHRLFSRQVARITQYAKNVIFPLLYKVSLTMLLALLFSFLISMDIYRLGRDVESLRASRLHDFYEQTAQPVVRFAYVVGRAMQAQTVIACANTVLTAIGLWILGVPSVVMLSLIVFVCSFVPVLGVFISTAPIMLVALNFGGPAKALAAAGMVCIIHAIEAYGLNPLIYGHHFKLNPVLVLMIVFVGHHAFGIWGMLLGVPVAYYIIHDVLGAPIWGERRLAAAGRPLGEMPRNEPAVAVTEETAARVTAPAKPRTGTAAPAASTEPAEPAEPARKG